MEEEITESEILDACEGAIAQGKADLLFELLEAFDFENMKLVEARALFYHLTVVCFQNGRDELVREISQFLGSVLIQGTGMEAFLFTEPMAKPQVLDFYYAHNGRDWSYYITSLYALPEEPDVQTAFANITALEVVRRTATYEQYQELLTKLFSLPEEETPNGQILEELLKTSASQLAPKARVPEYILPTTEFEFIQLETGTWTTAHEKKRFLSVPQHKELLRLLPVRPDTFGIDRTTLRSVKIKQIAQSMAQERYQAGEIEMNRVPFEAQDIEAKVEFMDMDEYMEYFENYERKAWEKRLQDDPHVFRILGPCHPRNGPYELDSSSPNPCLRYGGCRMMTCVEHEFEDDEEGLRFTEPELVDWFTGSCDRCSKEISQKHHATRAALEYGGFKGCYCSVEHAIKDCADNGVLVARELTEKISEQMITTGLYDRLWVEPVSRESINAQIERGERFLQYLRFAESDLQTEPEFAIPTRPIVITDTEIEYK